MIIDTLTPDVPDEFNLFGDGNDLINDDTLTGGPRRFASADSG